MVPPKLPLGVERVELMHRPGLVGTDVDVDDSDDGIKESIMNHESNKI